MKTFCLMLSFFTRLPVPRIEYTEERYVKGLPLIPFVGIVTGLLLYGLSFFGLIFDPPVVAMILLAGYIFITGGLHLDGLADTCDGIFSGREKERMLEIMKDSHVGSFGVLAMLLFVVFYMVMYQYLPYEALLIMPIVGKSAPFISASMADYIRPSGMGKLLIENSGKKELASALLLPFVVAAIVPFAVASLSGQVLQGSSTLFGDSLVTAALIYVAAVTAGLLSVVVLTGRLKKVLGGITGDTMGMVCEVSQMVFVFAVYVLQIIFESLIR